MVQGQVFLKVGGLALFLCNHLKVIIFTFRNYFILCKIVSDIFFLRIVFEEKKKFCHHNFTRKSHSKLSKNEPENIPCKGL